jgi:hypothetical protein
MKHSSRFTQAGIVAALLLTFTFSSCLVSLKDDDPAYLFHYYAEYHNNYNQTIAGYVLELDGSYNMSLNYDESITVNNNGGYYTSQYDYNTTFEFDGIIPVLEFEYVNAGGKAYSNTLGLADIDSIAVPDLPDDIDHDDDLVITWAGEPLKAGERIDVNIISAILDTYFDYTETVGATSITIPSSGLNTFIYDDINITLTRRKTIPLRNIKTEGDFTIEYISAKETVFVL